ncbi:uncharacterized protein LOC127290888 [Leptopilina boulardi]|uniref:uncharacterized protein LOC127290888 n=1 Tax=Leptopilina boulardi TaxID=63433 RepID=UPI0021F60FBE|nr:uncharacterized protein LOC127290888 [Leptopilina boulardi]
MSGLKTEIVAEGTSSTLLSTVTRLDSRVDISPISTALAISIVFILLLITISGNSIILFAFYRYKRLRTASNCLLVSLAVSDLGVGVFMPYGMYLELATVPESEVSTLCILPYCIVISLCSVSVLVTVAIAVDRLTSLAQPLRYKNIITHSSIEKYIAVFWIYAIAVGLSPLIYDQFAAREQNKSESCRFGEAISPPIRIFLVVAVWAPSALILLGCYMYVYLVARAHARAIYTVELSFRHQTQTLTLPRYGQTLAVTVGAFFILWLPFQTCMLLDIFCGTDILSEWTIWLGLPVLAHSGANPWIYAFHHGEMRIAAGKIAEDLVAIFGLKPSRCGCSPMRRGSNTNLELAAVNNSDERQPVEDCFAAKQHNFKLYTSRRCLEMSGKLADISPERGDMDSSSESCRQGNIIEENIHDLTKMLDPKYIIDRNHIIDSNHNVDKIKSLKYLLDPTFNKIRHLRRLNHKRMSNKNFQKSNDPKFTSYQNLKIGEISNKKNVQLNTMSDPALNSESSNSEKILLKHVLCHNSGRCQRRDSNLSSLSDPNIKTATGGSNVCLRLLPNSNSTSNSHRYSVQNLWNHKYEPSLAKSLAQCRHLENQKKFLPWQSRLRPTIKPTDHIDSSCPTFDLRLQDFSHSSLPTSKIFKENSRSSLRQKISPKHLNITSNWLANIIDSKLKSSETTVDPMERLVQAKKSFETLKDSESIFKAESQSRLLIPSRLKNSLNVPIVHSEPPSPIDPLPLASLEEEKMKYLNISPRLQTSRNFKSPVRHSDPIIPAVLLSIEDCCISPTKSIENLHNCWSDTSSNTTPTFDPIELSEALLKSREFRRGSKLTDTIFVEHDSTRYSSRRPSDSRWSESSRSQEILSNVAEHQKFPSSYSVNNFQNCTSGSDLNDVTSCLGSFMCPDALSSSLRESFFEVPSALNSDIFTSFEETDEYTNETTIPSVTMVHSSVSSVNFENMKAASAEVQSKSSESVFHNKQSFNKQCKILRLEPSAHQRGKVRPCKEHILEDNLRKKVSILAPLASPTPTEICTPTFDIVSDMKGEIGVSVRV